MTALAPMNLDIGGDDDATLLLKFRQSTYARLQKETAEERATLKAQYAKTISKSFTPKPSSSSSAEKIPRLEHDFSSSKPLDSSRTGNSGNSGGSGSSSNNARSCTSRCTSYKAPLKSDFLSAKPHNYISYDKLIEAKSKELNKQYQQGKLPSNPLIPTTAEDGLHYLDYTYDDVSIHHFTLSSLDVYEKLLEKQGQNHLRLQWCPVCEDVAHHRTKAWHILRSLMSAFPDFDYLHSLPSEIPEKHAFDLLNNSKHRIPLADCDEIYLLFEPRGLPLQTLKLTTADVATQALQTAISLLPTAALEIVLLTARNLKTLRLPTQSCNPFVKFKVEEDTLSSRFVEKTCNPNFSSQLFVFGPKAELPIFLEIEVLNCDPNRNKHRHIGSSSVPLSFLKADEVYRLTVELSDSVGEVNIVLKCFSPFPPGTPGKKHSLRFTRNKCLLPLHPSSNIEPFPNNDGSDNFDPNSPVQTSSNN